MSSTDFQIPMHDWNIVGHEHAINTLRRALVAQRVRHAYLFTGPEHIGKALLAQRFAQTLLCTGGIDAHDAPQNPCNACLSCRKVMHGNHPDIHSICRPPEKQFILNVQAANCLLKTLEEPEPDVVLLLTVPDPGSLLPTILSRVQQVPMQLLTTKQIKFALEDRWRVEPHEASLVAALAAGRMGWAVQAVEDEDMLAERQAQLETLAKLSTAGKVQRFDVAQRLSAESDKLHGILELWLLWWRDMVLAANNCLDLIVNVDMQGVIQNQAAKVGAAESQRMVRAILGTMEALDQNVNARVALEVLMLDLPMVR